MMDYFREHYGVNYAPNTRETVRRQTIHQFVPLGLVIQNPDEPRPVNSPDTCYVVEPALRKLAQAFGSDEWKERLKSFTESTETLRRLHARERQMARVPVMVQESQVAYLTGEGQNKLIKLIVEEFCSRFTPGGVLVCLGDAGEKSCDYDYLATLGVELDRHGKMPDVIVHDTSNNWLVLVEAVKSHGPIDIKRHNELKALFAGSTAPLVFVTAFPDRRVMARRLAEIAWETEVWVADSPSHLIHFDGERYLGPYSDE